MPGRCRLRIGLALSGGGTRAAVFHLGVIQRLAAGGLLEQVTKLSTVSGGSLVTALIFSHANLQWPTSDDYLKTIFPDLERLLTSADLFTFKSIAQSPNEWLNVFGSRAQIVANLLEKRWSVRGFLKDLSATPEWLINTTCVETGKNWRFSQRHMGDWTVGHHYDPPFKIAEAAAASAAVPYVIGSLKLNLPEDGWYEINPRNEQARERKERKFSAITLWDGGAYENLGLEPLYKLDRGMIDCDYVIVSDASGAMPIGKPASPLRLLKGDLSSPRLFDIASNQIRSLRSRIFVNALEKGDAVGALIRMGNSVRDIDLKTRRERTWNDYGLFQSDCEASLALKYPTNLSALSDENFERVARHGYEVADATLSAYCPALAPDELDWRELARLRA